jgi:cytosine/uracil/thiamine/allantoin permease
MVRLQISIALRKAIAFSPLSEFSFFNRFQLIPMSTNHFRNNLGSSQDFIRDGYVSFLLCGLMLCSLLGRHGMVALVALCSFYGVGLAFMVYVLIGTQQDLNRERKCTRLRDDRPQNLA